MIDKDNLIELRRTISDLPTGVQETVERIAVAMRELFESYGPLAKIALALVLAEQNAHEE